MKKVDVNGKPHLCLFALNKIKEGEEITYDYGGEDGLWGTQVCFIIHSVQKILKKKTLWLNGLEFESIRNI